MCIEYFSDVTCTYMRQNGINQKKCQWVKNSWQKDVNIHFLSQPWCHLLNYWWNKLLEFSHTIFQHWPFCWMRFNLEKTTMISLRKILDMNWTIKCVKINRNLHTILTRGWVYNRIKCRNTQFIGFKNKIAHMNVWIFHCLTWKQNQQILKLSSFILYFEVAMKYIFFVQSWYKSLLAKGEDRNFDYFEMKNFIDIKWARLHVVVVVVVRYLKTRKKRKRRNASLHEFERINYWHWIWIRNDCWVERVEFKLRDIRFRTLF